MQNSIYLDHNQRSNKLIWGFIQWVVIDSRNDEGIHNDEGNVNNINLTLLISCKIYLPTYCRKVSFLYFGINIIFINHASF